MRDLKEVVPLAILLAPKESPEPFLLAPKPGGCMPCVG